MQSIVGAPLTEVFPKSVTAPSGRVMAEARSVSAGPLRDVSILARAGEILGIAGLLGSGRTELLQMFFGCLRPTAGTLFVDGTEAHFRSPRAAMDAGVAYVAEDRTVEAAFPDLSVRVNISVADIPAIASGARIRGRHEKARTDAAMRTFRVRASSGEDLMSSLSGGNQQKVVLARWLARSPKLLLLDEPTQGVDVGARADAYALVRTAVDAGAAAILVSSDFEELAEMSDRVVVLREGRIVTEVAGPELTRHRLTELAFLAGKDSR